MVPEPSNWAAALGASLSLAMALNNSGDIAKPGVAAATAADTPKAKHIASKSPWIFLTVLFMYACSSIFCCPNSIRKMPLYYGRLLKQAGHEIKTQAIQINNHKSMLVNLKNTFI